MMERYRGNAKFLFALLLTSTLLCGQTFTARLAGTIRDPAGAPIPGATVTAVQLDTSVSRTVSTGEAGVYGIPLLLPGVYEVRVECGGFQTMLQRGVKLEVNQAGTLDFTMTLATLSTSVVVTDEAPLLQTETGNSGSTLDAKVIEDFPLVQRDVMGLLNNIPGVVAKDQVGDARAGRNVFDSTFSVSGGRPSTNEVLLDGAVNTVGDFNGVVISPPPDSVREFRVEANSFSAEFGRTGGGTVNIVTKAGTNEYHGTLFYYHKNDVLNANSFNNNRFNTPKTRLHQHQYGLSLGGPVFIPKLYNGRNKTFFFTAFEGRRENDPLQIFTSVPTALERQGDFSQTVYLSGATPVLIRIYDPSTSRIVNGVRTRDQFPGNVIPASRINPISKRLIEEYPDPNRSGSTVTHRTNYYYRDYRTYSRDVVTNRVDHYLSEKHRFFVRFSWQQNLDAYPSTIVRYTNSNRVFDNFRNIALDDTLQITPRLHSVFRYMYARYRANQISNTLGYDPTQLGLPSYIRDSANTLFYPNVGAGGDFPNLGGTAYNNQPRDTQGFSEQLVFSKGRHSFVAGAEYRLYRFYPFQVFNPTGMFDFTKNYTQRDQIAAQTADMGFGLASLLLGTGTFSYEHVEPLSAYHHYMATYVQDNFKVSQRLTVNLGLRWETETGTAEAHDRLTYFDPNMASPFAGTASGGVRFTGNGNPSAISSQHWKNFSPRAGLAFRIDAKTAMRAGYGLYFLPRGLEPGVVTTPFNYTLSADVLNTDYTPKTTISDPFPGGIIRPSSASRLEDGSYRLSNTIMTVLQNEPSSYVQQWNVAIGRQVGRRTVVDVTYMGSRGVHLPASSIELNQIDADYLAQGSKYLTELVPNPYYGKITTGLLSRPTVPRMQLLKPYPQFAAASTANAFGTSIGYYRPPIGDSVYHAMVLKVQRQYWKFFSATAHYTVSKLIDTVGTGNGAAYLDPSSYRDRDNIRLERSVSSYDVPQSLGVSWGMNLPFGKGGMFLKGHGWLNRIVGGWNVYAYHSYRMGFPIAVTGPDISRIAAGSAGRANVVAGVQAALPYSQSIANAKAYDPRTSLVGMWINPAAFSAAPEFTIANGPRFLPNVRGGRINNTDATIGKSITIKEGMRFHLQGRFFNLFNQVRFTGLSLANVSTANFGTASSPAGSPRMIEVGGKLYF